MAAAAAPAVSNAVAVAEDAAQGRNAGRASTGRGAGTEIRDRSLPGTVDSK